MKDAAQTSQSKVEGTLRAAAEAADGVASLNLPWRVSTAFQDAAPELKADLHNAAGRRILTHPDRHFLESIAKAVNSYHSNSTGANLLRQLVKGSNALRDLDVFACNEVNHDAECECFWEQCEAWAKADQG